MKLKVTKGFTLIELMVVIGIISILSGIVYANLGGSRARTRDVERQADLRNLKNAIEQYKNKYGMYPAAGCSGAANAWVYEKPCSQYIAGLAPEFITVLPHDANSAAGTKGYAYTTNVDRSVYKVIAMNTVESERVTNTHTFKRCDTSGICGVNGTCAPASASYQTSYAVWGGYAPGVDDIAVKTATAVTICK